MEERKASGHLYELIGVLAVDLTAEPEALFDELELWFGLTVTGYSQVQSLIPIGRYMRYITRGSTVEPFEKLVAEALVKQEDWAPLTEGWFNGKFPLFVSVSDKLRSRIESLRGAFY